MSVFRVSNVYTHSGHPNGREDELHIDIDGPAGPSENEAIMTRRRLIIPKSMLKRIADALLDANTIGRLRSSGTQPEPDPGPAKEIPAFTPADRARHDERMTKRVRASELLTKLQLSCPDHKEDLIELVVLCRGQGIL